MDKSKSVGDFSNWVLPGIGKDIDMKRKDYRKEKFEISCRKFSKMYVQRNTARYD